MGRYVVRRLLQFVPVFLGATLLIFLFVYALPGDPIRALGGDRPLPANVAAALRDRYNLDDPLLVQYGKYLGVLPEDVIEVTGESPGFDGVLQGDLGESFERRPVADIIRQRLPITARLALLAFLFQAVVGVGAGVAAALRRGSWLDQLVTLSTIAAISVPSLVLGYAAQLLLGVRLGWFPINASDGTWGSLVLPALVLGTVPLAYISRLMRTSLLESLAADYVRTATAKGLRRRRVIGIHAMRNSMVPVVTYLGLLIGNLLAGAAITEQIFNVPGLGRQIVQSIGQREGFVVVGVVTFLVGVYLVASLVVDLLYALLDPRIRYE